MYLFFKKTNNILGLRRISNYDRVVREVKKFGDRCNLHISRSDVSLYSSKNFR